MIKIGDIYERRSSDGTEFIEQSIVVGISGRHKMKAHMGTGTIVSAYTLESGDDGWIKVGSLVYGGK